MVKFLFHGLRAFTLSDLGRSIGGVSLFLAGAALSGRPDCYSAFALRLRILAKGIHWRIRRYVSLARTGRTFQNTREELSRSSLLVRAERFAVQEGGVGLAYSNGRFTVSSISL